MKGQSAIEYLMTYGWAIAILIIILGLLFTSGLFSPSYLVNEECELGPNFPCDSREDFRIYADEKMSGEILTIKTPQVFDIWASYNVEDPATGEKVGTIKRRALRSVLRDEWTFISPEGKEIGKLTETSMGRALLSRLINLIPFISLPQIVNDILLKEIPSF